MNAVHFSSAGMSILALEIEMTDQQQAADRAARDVARQAKLAEMKAEEDDLAEQADALMQEAFVGGAMRMGAGLATFSAGASELDAARGTPADPSVPDAGPPKLTEAQLTAKEDANGARLLAAGFEAGDNVSGKLHEARRRSLDHSAAQHRRMAEQADHGIEDKTDAIRRREDQFAQKLAVLQEALRTEQETAKAIVRG